MLRKPRLTLTESQRIALDPFLLRFERFTTKLIECFRLPFRVPLLFDAGGEDSSLDIERVHERQMLLWA